MTYRPTASAVGALVLTLAALILGACVVPQATSVAGIPSMTPIPTSQPAVTLLGNRVQIEPIGRYDVDRLNAVLTTELADFSSYPMTYPPARYAVNLYRVTYPSVIPEQGNRPTVATGLLAIPETGEKMMPMISYQHGTVYQKREVPSFPDESMETRLMLAQFAGQGYVVIGADYFGMGLSTENDSYIVKASQQQACLDMYFAALAALDEQNIQVTDFFIAGWSQGGFVTMAFLEKLESLGIAVKAASTASAPTEALAMFNALLLFPRPTDVSWTSVVFILSAFSFEEYYRVPGLAQAFFLPEQYDFARRVYYKEPFEESEFPADLHELIRPEYFDPQYLASSAYGRLLKETQAYRWVIKTPLRNYYGEVDEVLTSDMGRLPMVYQHTMGNTVVEAISAGPEANHRGTFVYAVSEQKKWFDSLLTR